MACTLRKQLFNWKRLALTACAALMPFAASGQGQGLHVFACEPEWAALVKALAPQAQVTSATHARQDPHHIEARPLKSVRWRRRPLHRRHARGQQEGKTQQNFQEERTHDRLSFRSRY